MIDKIFKLKGKTLVIIDWANVFGWVEKTKWEIDPKKLFKYLKNYPEVKDIRFYFGIETDNKKSIAFQKKIKQIGYTLISKQVKWVPVSLDKAHFKIFLNKLIEIADGLEKSDATIAKRLKKLPRIPIYRRKCDFDCEIAIDVMKNVDNFDSFILFSGDGDYAVLMEEIIRNRKQAIVVALKNTMGREYSFIKRGVYICNIKRLKNFVKKIPGRRTYRA